MYIVCEKTYFDRLGEKIKDEINLHDSDNINGILEFLRKQNIYITKRTIYHAMKNNVPIKGKYMIYKIKSETD